MLLDRARRCWFPRARPLARLTLVGAFAALAACGDSPTENEEPVATTVTLSHQQVTLASLGETHLLTASVRDQNGSAMASAAVAWSSSDAGVATVAPNGVVTAVTNGTATITAASGSASATSAATVDQVGASVQFAELYIELADVGDMATIEATVRDGRDNEIVDATLEWTSDDPTVADVTDEGVVTATGTGAAKITATVSDTGPGPAGSTPASAAIAVFVDRPPLLVTGTDPAVLVEGSPGVIEGVGFSPVATDNTVTLAGLAVQVTAATATTLDIVVPLRDCQPERQEELVVDVLGLSWTDAAQVSPEDPLDLAVGEGAFATDGCLPLIAGTGGEQYLVGALSTSEVVSGTTPVEIEGLAGEAPIVAPPMLASVAGARGAGMRGAGAGGLQSTRVPVASGDRMPGGARGTFSVPVDRAAASLPRTGDASGSALRLQPRPDYRSGEAEIRRRDRRILATLGRAGALISGDPRQASGDGPLAAVPSVGDTLSLNVPTTCTDFVSVQAKVVYVGTAGVWLEDTDNPVQAAFTVQEYQAFDALLAQTLVPTVTSYFGAFEDIDANGRTLVLVTKEVNERPNIAGFVHSADIVPPGTCPAGNSAEIFYGIAPDPNGDHGDAFTKQQALDAYPPLIAHELTHVSQFTQLAYGSADLKATWEYEGGATLTEQLVGFQILGHGPGQDLGFTEWELGFDNGWYSDWVVDLAAYFGLLPGQKKAVGAPEECSWLDREENNNNGPCVNGRAPYGTPATLLRWVLDAYGPTSGGEQALMRELTGSAHSGFSTLTQATGESTASLLTQFAAGLWADGRLGDWLPSWNLFDIFQNLVSAAQLDPYTSASAEPSLEVGVRGGSSAYLEWSPPGPHAPTSLRLRAQGGGAAPGTMVLWVLRIS